MGEDAGEDMVQSVLVRQRTTGHDDHQSGVHSNSKRHNRCFSVSNSTEELFKSLDDFGFYGAHGHIRKQLDYSYHQHYRKERQWLHDSIIEDYLHNGAYADPNCLPCEPWLILTVGCQGAGKRFLIDKLVNEEKLKLLSFVCIDTGTWPLISLVCSVVLYLQYFH